MKEILITAGALIALATLLGCYAALILSSQISQAEEQREREAREEREAQKREEARKLHDDSRRYSGLLEDDEYD